MIDPTKILIDHNPETSKGVVNSVVEKDGLIKGYITVPAWWLIDFSEHESFEEL
jgi:hypothetical protein